MIKGRKPKPINTFQPTNPINRAPDYLPDEGKKLYRKLASELADILSSLDTTTLSAYCYAFCRWKDAEAQVSEQGMIGPNGKPNPAVRIAESMLRQMRYYGSELGLSPLARGRIQAETNKGATDELEAFLQDEGE